MYEKSENKCGDNSHKYLAVRRVNYGSRKGYFAEYQMLCLLAVSFTHVYLRLFFYLLERAAICCIWLAKNRPVLVPLFG